MIRTVLLFLAAVAVAPEPKKSRKPNALAKESSPYLLQHAHNPVHWLPWGPEAFARAKKEKKLVFLSIGYSSCHWCHVMEKESFEDEGVAKILNEHFICIKVDREERPDVDQVYMAALNAIGHSGGWPLSMFLTADGKPIDGGTYWPREDKTIEGSKYPGFKSILGRVIKLQKDSPEKVAKRADTVAAATRRRLRGLPGIALVSLDRALVKGVTTELGDEFDKVHGGFGNSRINFRGPKFPTTSTLIFLLGEARRGDRKAAQEMAEFTLDQMARGGIYDQLGGGFHRYTVERTWTVPHFEKMLYDNAQLLEAYAAAYALTKKPQYARVLRETAEFVKRELTSPEGAFYSALDADSDGEEGKFYVWTAKELEEALPKRGERELFAAVYATDKGYNFEGKYHILKLPVPLEEAAKKRKETVAQLDAKLAPLRKRLFEIRAKRKRPFLDTKVLTAWNGQMIAGLARAGQALGDKALVARAEKAADFVLKNLKTKEGRLRRSWAAVPGEKPKARFNAYLDDYAYLVHGLLALHEATGKKRWLDEAAALTAAMIKYHEDEDGGFFYTSSDHEKLFARGKGRTDGAQPSGNSVAASNLVRLWIATGDNRHEKRALATLKPMAGQLKSYPTSLCWAAEALGLYLEKKK